MKYFLNDEQSSYWFSKDFPPVLTIDSGDTVEFETKDCLSNVLQKQTDRLEDTSFDPAKTNPATGPVYIRGAEPGDALEIHIDSIRLKDRAVITCQAKYGLIGKYFDKTTFRVTPVHDDIIEFNEKIKIPADKMIGVIGIAPREGVVRTEHKVGGTGNMDNTMMREGATLYIPVEVEGALMSVGDVHAVMGDGEINCSAIEAPAFVTLTITLRKGMGKKMRYPMLKTDEYFSVVASEDTADAAIDASVDTMANLMKDYSDAAFDDISMLLSAVGQVQVCQVSNKFRTVRFLMPWYVLNACNFKFF